MTEQLKTWIENNTCWKLTAISASNELEYLVESSWMFPQLDELFLQFPILRVVIQTKRDINNKIITTLTISNKG